MFEGSTQVALLKRGLTELVAWLFQAQDFPVGAVLLTGTSVIPAVEFTLRGGDEVRIAITGLGELREHGGGRMRAIVWQGPNEMTVEEQPQPEDPGPGELILRPEAVGICGSEVEGYLGHMGNRTPPLVMGHEFAGVVVAAGEGASEFDGARVAVNPLERLRRVPAVPVRAFQPLPRPRADRRARPGRVRRLRQGPRGRRARAARRRLLARRAR